MPFFSNLKDLQPGFGYLLSMEFSYARFAHLLLAFFCLGETLRHDHADHDEPIAAILDQLTSDEGKPNPRISCSPGIQHARQLLAEKMKFMQLEPMGQGGDYFFTVPKTNDEDCPGGITNLIGGLEGSDKTLKNEYLLLNAHLDGPFNLGPTARHGNLETDNSYDDGGSVAALLSLAQYFKKNPLKRSLIIFLSDGEEGIHNVATSPMWKKRFCQSTAYKGGHGLKRKSITRCYISRFI